MEIDTIGGVDVTPHDYHPVAPDYSFGDVIWDEIDIEFEASKLGSEHEMVFELDSSESDALNSSESELQITSELTETQVTSEPDQSCTTITIDPIEQDEGTVQMTLSHYCTRSRGSVGDIFGTERRRKRRKQ